MKRFPFLSTPQLLEVLRIVLGLFMMAHGIMRVFVNSLEGFGEFLSSKGLPLGFFLAWGVTIYDIIGGALLALGYFRKIISFGFIIILFTGIILVHAPNGWFTVGHQSGGVEYSVLLIVCFLVIASTQKSYKA